jgi:ABC-type sugar transport system permease subunit
MNSTLIGVANHHELLQDRRNEGEEMGEERRGAPGGRIDPLAKASFAAALSPFAWLFVYYLPPVAIAVALSGPVLALIFGYRARRSINVSNKLVRGRGLMRAALILGWIEVVLYALAAVFLLYLFTFGIGDVCQGKCLP